MTVENKIIEELNKIRPYLNSDGGDIEFIKFEDGIVYVKVLGACEQCAFVDSTINDGIQEILTSEIPEVIGVINI